MQKVPKKFKFTKVHKRLYALKNSKINYNKLNIIFGLFGISAIGSFFLNFNQLETIRRVIVRYLKRSAKLWFRLIIIWPQTKKSKKSRMGKGRGKLYNWLCYISSGSIFLEISINPFIKLQDFSLVLKSLKEKLPIDVSVIHRNLLQNK